MLLNRFKLDWKYAIGEILLIAIGVLIALGVDGWREYRAERELESEYIDRIENDLRSSLDTWDGHMARLESAIEFLENVRNGDMDFVGPDNVEEIWNAFMISHWFAPPAIRSSAFAELVSTGRLSIIEEVALRDSIASFYTDYSSIAEMSAQMEDHSYTRFTRFAFPYEVFHAGQISGDLDAARVRASLQDLRSRPEFDDLSNAQLTTHLSNIQFMQMYRGVANSLLEEIASYKDQQ